MTADNPLLGALVELPPPGVPPELIASIVASASDRARRVLNRHRPDDPLASLVELFSQYDEPARPAEIAARAGVSVATLSRLRIAYRLGGRAGLDNAMHLHNADTAEIDAAARAIESVIGARASRPEVDHNTLTYELFGVQLRLGRDDHWYPYTRSSGTWMPAAHPAATPSEAFASATEAAARRRG
ncbi:hypothetical protein GCM10009745_63310 [Kribbella yunnanensis]|uniref:Uncharacterized protein n=1 Tax=Kribbella yunnanensis TaxID=190194 RepID=A0ABP4UJK7_9ACTN